MISLPINPPINCWAMHAHSPLAKERQILLITGLASASIALLTISLLAHLQVLVGLNAVAQGSLIGGGALLALTAGGVIACSPPREPSVAINDSTELKDYLEKMVQELVKGGNDPLKVIHQYADIISLDMLEGATGVKDALQLATRMLRDADFYLEARNSLSPTLRARLMSLRDTLVSVGDNFLGAFGVADFFKPSESAFHADFKFQKIMMLISLFTLLTATLLPMLGVTTGASIVGGCMLLIAVLSVIWPYVRPPLSRLPSGENYSEQIRSGAIWTSGGRRGVTTQIYNAFKAKKHVLLIGPSGIGKTQTAQAFTQALERGDFPELAGKKVFYFNTAELVASADMFSHQNTVLKRIEEAMGNHREDYILIFDEIHVAFEKHENNPFGDKLKTFLDAMPYLIGLTTREEYTKNIYTDAPAADRRFKKITVESTEPEETEAILNHHLVRIAPDALVESGAFAELIKQTEGKPQPLSALGVLSQCAAQVTHIETTPATLDRAKKETELLLASSSGVVLGAESLEGDAERYAQIERMAQELENLKTICQKEAEQLRILALTRKRLAEVREAKYKLVHEMGKSGPSEKNLNQLLLVKYYVEPTLEKRIKEIAQTLKVKAVIDKESIRDAVQIEQANYEKRQEAIAQARREAQSRVQE
ncbi:AAA family ATPase [Chlamydiota bacterium]